MPGTDAPPGSVPAKSGGWRDLPADAGVALCRLADQIDYHGRRARRDKLWYRWLKGTTLVAAGGIAVAGALSLASWVGAVLGAAIMVVEAFLGLNGHYESWMRSRTTAEELKREKYLFLAGAGPYRGEAEPEKQLAARIEEIVAGELKRWAAAMQQEPEEGTAAALGAGVSPQA